MRKPEFLLVPLVFLCTLGLALVGGGKSLPVPSADVAEAYLCEDFLAMSLSEKGAPCVSTFSARRPVWITVYRENTAGATRFVLVVSPRPQLEVSPDDR